MQADVVIIGGGMAGLAAAQAWHQRGKKVIVVEQWHCGAGATGKSSGFVTPNAELSLTDFTHRYNAKAAFEIWNFISQGVEDIRSNIINHKFQCDYQPQDTLIVANSTQALKTLEIEHHNLEKFGYQTKFYTQKTIDSEIGSKNYVGGVAYQNTFGINGYQYCQELKTYLQSVGVLIFEETAVLQIDEHTAITAHAKITGDYIIVCTDRFTPELDLLKQDIYHAQTFLMASQVLSKEQIKTIFPHKNLMVWDTDFIYQYFRVTGDNRLLVGGGDLITTYASKATHEYKAIVQKLSNYINYNFPSLDITFEYEWSGLMGISKDIGPIAGQDKNRPYLYYATAATGLPIATALGRYSAEKLLDNNNKLDNYFSPYRKFPISGITQSLLGNKVTFALCNLIKTNIP
ncbi:FAD-binding oxidoreductase [Candidatus Babeliales bacterium]|nr:FAD-binding oxidoreductase [Candidatus Babeliales bacterium]MBP9844228.1 FAD-binding oxidoreductase [Candidatus Babeliales bacterium]